MRKDQAFCAHQEIIAALHLPGPFERNGKCGWGVQELAAACPSVREPHHASLVLNAMAKAGVSWHVGNGSAARHYLRSSADGGGDCPEKWRPSRELVERMSRVRGAVPSLLEDAQSGGAYIQDWIHDAWADCSGSLLTREEVQQAIWRRHPDCQAHLVSQRMHEMVRTGKLRQHEEPGNPIAFIPVYGLDLFSLGPVNSKLSDSPVRVAPVSPSDVQGCNPLPGPVCNPAETPINGILPEVSVYFGDASVDSEVTHDREARAFVALDADGNICSIRLLAFKCIENRI